MRMCLSLAVEAAVGALAVEAEVEATPSIAVSILLSVRTPYV
jgi:hypothetical protein